MVHSDDDLHVGLGYEIFSQVLHPNHMVTHSFVFCVSGGLDIVFGIPFELMAPLMGVLVLIYALICIVGSMKAQV
jgi:hypothetical protein